MTPLLIRRFPRLSLTASVLLLALPSAAFAAPVPATGERIYRDACANCHGMDGTGAPREVVGFEEPLPDFSDCSFATREPNADWFAVTHDGGPARAFARMMPALGDALSAPEIELALGHVRTFCRSREWPRGELNLPRPLVTEKAYPEDEAVLTTTVATEGPGSVANKLVYERRFGARNQLEVIVPFAWEERGIDPGLAGGAGSSDWEGGVGDIAIGAKRALYHSLERGSIFSVAGEVKLPTGDDDEGFGAGHAAFEPFVAFGQILPADAFLHFQGGMEIPIDAPGANDEGFLRLALGRSFQEGRFGRVWSPMVELLAARELASGATTHWDAVPQFQVTLSTRQHVMANLGVRIPLNDTGHRDPSVVAYLLWDWFDGGFFDGW
jgi:hypothetical protein